MQEVQIPVVTIIGRSGSGKTTLLEKLIAEIRRGGYHVATIKHHSHSGFDIDHPGKDSWRHARSGSEQVIIAAPEKIASYRQLSRELSLDEILQQVEGVDIVLVEGYKNAGKPALEVTRAANGGDLVGNPDLRFAVAADFPVDVNVPQFDLDDVQGIAGLIESRFLNGTNGK